jgi:hypothetical protein
MPRQACSKDGNHNELCDALRKLGWDVISTYQFAQYAAGFPDAIVAKWPIVAFCEIKAGTGKLTADERAFHLAHKRDYFIVVLRTVEDCEALNGLWERRKETLEIGG